MSAEHDVHRVDLTGEGQTAVPLSRFSRKVGTAFVPALLMTMPVLGASLASGAEAKHQDMTVKTRDGVVLHCVYYPGADDKQTVPVILLHGWSGPRGAGSSRDFDELAVTLQSNGHAVIVPDLRGHGESRVRRLASGAKTPIDRQRLGTRGLRAMVTHDVESVKRFLIELNNQGKLNIELLCVVGCEMGAAVAANWAAQDWAWPSIRNLKQGRDVRALVLVSPPASFRNLSIVQSLSFAPMQRLPMMMVHGAKHAQAARDAQRIYRLVAHHHQTEDERKNQTLVFVEQPTSLQGIELLDAHFDTIQQIQDFLRYRVAGKKDTIPWRPRNSATNPS